MRHIGKEVLIEAEGKTYKLSRFTRNLLDKFLNWADSKIPHPLDTIRDKMQGFSEHMQEIMVRDAIQSAKLRRSINSPEVQALMATPEGIMKIVTLLFQRYHPELSEQNVADIFDTCDEEHGSNYLVGKIAEANGVYVPKEGEGDKEDSFPESTA